MVSPISSSQASQASAAPQAQAPKSTPQPQTQQSTPQPKDTVKLSSAGDVDHDGDSK